MSLVGYKAKNHPQQEAKDWVDDRRTPRDLFDSLHSRHQFTVDAAASEENHLLPAYWTRTTDALAQSWEGHRVYCNPPYSDLGGWVRKSHHALLHERCELVVMLLPANRCEQSWWQECVEPYRDGRVASGVRVVTEFLPGRLRFGWPASRPTPLKGDRPPFGCVVVTMRYEGD